MTLLTESDRCRECGIYVPQLPTDFLADAQIHLARQIQNIPLRAWLEAFDILENCRRTL